jgi:hypothetical protein
MRCFRHGLPEIFCLWLFATLALPAYAATPVVLSADEQYLAVSVTGPIGEEGITAKQFLITTNQPGAIPSECSLWEDLLLNFAVQQDPKLARLSRKQAKLQRFALGNVIALNGLGAGQSIPFLAAPVQTLFARQLLGVITTGVSFTGIGVQTWFNRKYQKEQQQYLATLKQRVRHVVDRLRQGENPELVRMELDDLVGPLAGKEFTSLWVAAHPTSESPSQNTHEACPLSVPE